LISASVTVCGWLGIALDLWLKGSGCRGVT
jgi:hypothetical protein